ncbi:hypothetical protein P8452_19209 [Trifolium repens]|nr:hypothetical protein P8452_19209 [Trifolium repens]
MYRDLLAFVDQLICVTKLIAVVIGKPPVQFSREKKVEFWNIRRCRGLRSSTDRIRFMHHHQKIPRNHSINF